MGRPRGSQNVPTLQLIATPRCPKCGSTDRERYRFVSSVRHGGITSSGLEYTHTVRRRTRCLACQQVRIDVFLENSVPLANPGDENEPLAGTGGSESVTRPSE